MPGAPGAAPGTAIRGRSCPFPKEGARLLYTISQPEHFQGEENGHRPPV